MMLRLGAVYMQQLRFKGGMSEPLPKGSLPLPESPKVIRSRGPVVETYEGKQTNPDEAVLPMPPHRTPLDLKADVAKMLQQKKLNFEGMLQKGKTNWQVDWQQKKDVLALHKELSSLGSAIQKIASAESFAKMNFDGMRKVQFQAALKKVFALLKRRF